MTSRIFDVQRPPELLLKPSRDRQTATAQKPRDPDMRTAVLVALVLVPIAGAAEPPLGWVVAGATAVLVLSLALIGGSRVPWGLLTLGAAGLGFWMPRGTWSALGPGLFVATVECGLLWLSSSPDQRGRGPARRPDARGRAAQVLMGLSGERHVGRVLAEQLPEEYALINGLALPRGSGDIDHLVIGPTGVFLLETKTMAGHIVCAPDGTWHRTRIGRAGTPYEAYIGNPSSQVQPNIFAVRQTLRRRLPESISSVLWIEGLVVFAHPRTELDATHSSIPAVLLEHTSQRICEHVPRRRLSPEDVNSVVTALREEAAVAQKLVARQTAQAIVELAVMLPAVLALGFSTLAISRVVQTHNEVVAIAHEVARAGALAGSPAEAAQRMQSRAVVVASGFGLDPGRLVLEWDLTHFADTSGAPDAVQARASYPVDLQDLPLVGGLPPLVVSGDHVEWIDPFRSGIQSRPQQLR